jgi:sensor histidine kinase YesM
MVEEKQLIAANNRRMKKVSTSDRKNNLKIVGHIFLLNCAATAVVVCIEATRGDWAAALAFGNVFGAFIYSNCIGTLTGSVVIFGVPAWREYKPFFRFVFLTTAILATTFLGIALANLIFLTTNMQALGQNPIFSGKSFLFAFLIAFVFGFGTYVQSLSQAGLQKAREQLQKREVDVARAEALTSEAQLASLESRLQPHFLFNTLNSIAALIREDPVQAEQTVEKLARLLRYSLEVNNNRLVEFSRELKITCDYLEIERVRFGERLKIHVESGEEFGKIMIPPFTLQTLAENSIKHVAAKRSGAVKISISARRNEDLFIIEVDDDGAGFTSDSVVEGHGLDNLQKRLARIFAGKAAFEIIRKIDGGGCVRISLPFYSDK